MNELFARATAWFVAPAPARSHRAPAPPPALAGVLATAGDLEAVAGGVAAELRRRHRAPAAVVCAPGGATSRPAAPGARALARRFAGQGLEAAATGTLCRAALPDDPESAARTVWRAVAVAGALPVVVARPARDPAFDELLAHADLLLVAVEPGAPVPYAELALASLCALGPPVTRIAPPAGFAARRAAALGLARLGLDPEGLSA